MFPRIPKDSVSNVIAQIYGDSIAYHLFYFCFRSLKIEIFGESLNHATLHRGQRAYSFERLHRVARMQSVTFWHRSVHATDCRAWLGSAENPPSRITAWMTVIIFYLQFVAKIFCNTHFMVGQFLQESGFHKIILSSKFTNHYKSLPFLWNSTQCSIKHGVCEAIADRLEYFKCILKLLCLQYTFHILHDKPPWPYLGNNSCITNGKVSTPVVFVAFARRRKILTRRAANNHVRPIWTNCLYGLGYIHQISMYCRMGKVVPINCQCVNPIVESCNDIHSGLLESET